VRIREGRLGTASYLAFLVWTLVLVAVLTPAWAWGTLVAVLAFGMLDGGRGLRMLGRPHFWLFVLSIVVVGVLFLGTPDVRWSIFRLSREGLSTGAWMALRAATLTLAFSVTIGALSVAQVIRLFDRIRLRGLGFALGVALNLGPVLQNVAEAAYHTLRLRGAARRPLHSGRLFLITVIANGLRYGDDVVKAAYARAFDPSAPSSVRSLQLSLLDQLVLAALVIAGAAALALMWLAS
jgi:hypothetical protein